MNKTASAKAQGRAVRETLAEGARSQQGGAMLEAHRLDRAAAATSVEVTNAGWRIVGKAKP